MLPTIQHAYRSVFNKVGPRIFLYFLSLSILCIVVACSVFFYAKYDEQIQELNAESSALLASAQEQLALQLWTAKDNETQQTLSAITSLPHVIGVRVTYGDAQFFEGEFSRVDQTLSIISAYPDEQSFIALTYDVAYIVRSIAVSNSGQLIALVISILMMGFAFFIIVKQSLLRHIQKIYQDRHTSIAQSSNTFHPVVLPRYKPNDELSYLMNVYKTHRQEVATLRNNTKQIQKKFDYQHSFDVLTGLPNRKHFLTYMNKEIESYQTDKGRLFVFLINVHGLQQLHDDVGQKIGDVFLQKCSQLVQSIANSIDAYVARLSENEFIVAFYSKNSGAYKTTAKYFINSFDRNITYNDLSIKISCSIGITFYPHKMLHNPKIIIQSADCALQKATQSGKNTFALFDELMLKKIQYEKIIKKQLIKSIYSNAFDVYFQPLFNVAQQKIIGFEALTRWNDTELGNVDPSTFIPLAESTGVIFNIDINTFEKAYKQVKQWRETYNQPYILSVNFSPTNFYHGKFFNWLSTIEIINSGDVDWVEFEITERLVLNDDAIVIEGINGLRSRGIKFSIDDFGIGYSSLAYIKKFGHLLSKIKIDKMFINDLDRNNFDLAFIKSIMMLSKTLNLKVLAEGVERREQTQTLREVGCEYAQGFYLSRPQASPQISKLLQTFSSR